ncbi:hypothetical protein ACHAWF_015814, partial [Thalassiosira exigua]
TSLGLLLLAPTQVQEAHFIFRSSEEVIVRPRKTLSQVSMRRATFGPISLCWLQLLIHASQSSPDGSEELADAERRISIGLRNHHWKRKLNDPSTELTSKQVSPTYAPTYSPTYEPSFVPRAAAKNIKKISFVAFGDIPYTKEQRFCLNKQLRELDQEKMDFKFMVHVGDLKWGKSPCYESSFSDIAEMFAHPSNAMGYNTRDC